MTDKNNYLQLQLLTQQLQELEETIKYADEQMDHAAVAISILSELGGEGEKELLVPVGNGVFLTVVAKDIKNVKTIVGANVVVEKPSSYVLEKVKQQLQSITEYQNQSMELYEQVVAKATELQKKIENV